MTERTVVSEGIVPSYVPRESEITRVEFDNGDVVYRNVSGYDINVYETELDIVIGCWVDRLRTMVRLLEEDEHVVATRINLDTLLQAFEREMDELLDAVYSTVGLIHCHRVGLNIAPWRQGRVVGAELEPVEDQDEKTDTD